jgi:hypothetical protein
MTDKEKYTKRLEEIELGFKTSNPLGWQTQMTVISLQNQITALTGFIFAKEDKPELRMTDNLYWNLMLQAIESSASIAGIPVLSPMQIQGSMEI